MHYKDSVRTSQRTNSASIRKTSRWMLYIEIDAVYRENHMKYVPRGEDAILSAKPGGAHPGGRAV
jgi:hypothetical protein